MDTVKKVQKQVEEILGSDNSGHGMDHTNRVMNLALRFADGQDADTEVVALIALLHDVDDYKLFGAKNAEELTNARKILDSCGINENVKAQVIEAIKTIGYSKRLKGIVPTTIEGMLTSDADMCDGMGVTGVLRSYQYNLAHRREFFNKNVYPVLDMTAEEYKAKNDGTVVTHLFEKIMRLKDLMLTEPGRVEAEKRHDFVVKFLYQYFEEENVPEWGKYLDEYLEKNQLKKIVACYN